MNAGTQPPIDKVTYRGRLLLSMDVGQSIYLVDGANFEEIRKVSPIASISRSGESGEAIVWVSYRIATQDELSMESVTVMRFIVPGLYTVWRSHCVHLDHISLSSLSTWAAVWSAHTGNRCLTGDACGVLSTGILNTCNAQGCTVLCLYNLEVEHSGLKA